MAKVPRLSFDAIEEAHRQWLAHDLAEAEAMSAATSIIRAQQLILRRVDAALRPFGLTFARYEVLALLSFSRRGSLPLGKMGDRLMVHPASVTNAIDRLEKSELVRRTEHPTDRRTTLAEITPLGLKVAREATQAVTATAFGLASLEPEELEVLTRVLRRLRLASGDFMDSESGEAPVPR
jgi:DNA-binding MarR family transcriptional regulator